MSFEHQNLPEPEVQLHLLEQPKRLPAGEGWAWIRQAWRIFRMRSGMWVAMTLILGLVSLGVTIVFGLLASISPALAVVANILNGIVMTALMAGMIFAAHKLLGENRFEISMLFEGISRKFSSFAILALFNYACVLLAQLVMSLVSPTGKLMLMSSVGMEQQIPAETMTSALSGPAGFLSILLFFVLYLPAMMMLWFASSLVMLHDIKPLQAMKMSLQGCLANIRPMLVYGLACFGFSLLITVVLSLLVLPFIAAGGQAATAIMMGLGMIVVMIPLMLVLLPVLVLTYYTSYRGVWTDIPLE
ncbi:BPSS1780 family membrane protein [Neisseria sp.]|uniref:BPSS1780 family membrane protein n=1 Tax=Neisseria sp. TaxID=192066 RepID=UPI00359F1CEB